MLRDLRSELYNRILRFPLPHLRNTSTGQLVAMILGEVEDLGRLLRRGALDARLPRRRC